MGPESERPGEEYANWKAPETGSQQKVEQNTVNDQERISMVDHKRAIHYFQESARLYLNDGDDQRANQYEEMAEAVKNLLNPEGAVDAFAVAKAIAKVGKDMDYWQDEIKRLQSQPVSNNQEKYKAETALKETRIILNTLNQKLMPEVSPNSNSTKGEIYGLTRRLDNMAIPGLKLNKILQSPDIDTLSQSDSGLIRGELDQEIGNAYSALADIQKELPDKQLYEGIQDVYRLQQVRDQI